MCKKQDDHEKILECLKNPREYPSLGRHEDLIRVDKICETEVAWYNKEVITSLDMYCTKTDIFSGTIYKLHKDYTIVENKRIFNDVKVLVIPAGTKIKAPVNDFENPVFFC